MLLVSRVLLVILDRLELRGQLVLQVKLATLVLQGKLVILAWLEAKEKRVLQVPPVILVERVSKEKLVLMEQLVILVKRVLLVNKVILVNKV